ncbi:hypothetical protein RJ640_026250 [Escallonia rubra]|uniref:tRNA-binding domain-containing protein n=1 Tax=Escallonia rubra TaxID=112253 RepID=A0AA88R742_9ASTE|nr:hypothetical protein RJ640_026250 [Escallonia rubra]
MASAKESRKRSITSALCKHYSLDPVSTFSSLLGSRVISDASTSQDVYLAETGNDIKSSCLNVLKASGAEVPLENNGEVGLSDSDKDKVLHLMRWMDYIQSVVKFGELFERILIQKAPFDPPVLKAVVKGETEPSTKKTVQVTKDANSLEAVPSTKKSVDTLVFTLNLQFDYLNLTPFILKNFKKKVTGDNKAVPEKKKLPEKVPDANDAEVSVSLLKIQIGLIRKAWKHPSADSLLVEEIDVGDPKVRHVVSGLAKFCSPEELMNRRVALITNVKPGKLRDVMSEGLVLCASSEDHTAVEPLIVPEGARIGECVSFTEHEGKPEDVLNPKKKQLDKITPTTIEKRRREKEDEGNELEGDLMEQCADTGTDTDIDTLIFTVYMGRERERRCGVGWGGEGDCVRADYSAASNRENPKKGSRNICDHPSDLYLFCLHLHC